MPQEDFKKKIKILHFVFCQSQSGWIWSKITMHREQDWLVLVKRNPKARISSTCVGLMALLFLAVFNMPHSPLGELRSQPYIGQLGKFAESKTGSGEVRVTYWKAVSKLVSRHKPLEFPDGSKDVLNVLRPLIGYGSEAPAMPSPKKNCPWLKT
jgi:hypothetical protein